MKIFRLFALAFVLLSTLLAADPPASLAKKNSDVTGEGDFMFSLLPKAFQKNPNVSMTVLTEMTEEGKKLTPPTAEQTTYYLSQSGGYHEEGLPSGGTPPNPAEIERAVQRSLSSGHYLPAPQGQSPELLVLFHWGSHEGVDGDFADARKTIIGRAALAGGKKFSEEFAHVLAEEDTYKETGGYALYGGLLSPLRIFTDKSGHNAELVAQSVSACYYVVVSAYDYAKLARGQRILLWRTKMTVDSRGISMTETLPMLIATGGPYFGREMDQAVTPLRRVPRQGKVQVGTPEVVKDSPATEAPLNPAAVP